jgi:hypothetical protein
VWCGEFGEGELDELVGIYKGREGKEEIEEGMDWRPTAF